MRNLETRIRRLEPLTKPDCMQWLSVIVGDDETDEDACDRALAEHFRSTPESNPAGKIGYIVRYIVSAKPPEQDASR